MNAEPQEATFAVAGSLCLRPTTRHDDRRRGCYHADGAQGGAGMAVRDTAHRKLRYEDYARISADGKRHEIIDGEHHVSPSPNTNHQVLSRNLIDVLSPFVRKHKLGQLFSAPYDVLLSPHDIVQPDILFISTAHRAIITEANVQGAPDLVIEILSPSTRHLDETLKRQRYEQLGVQEYWIFDPRRLSVRVFRRSQDTGFGAPSELTAAASPVVTTPLLPGLEIVLRDIFTYD
jgi:Uma2 family endonuclease